MTISDLQMLIDLADKFQNEYYPREKTREQGTDVYNAVDIVSKAASDEIDKNLIDVWIERLAKRSEPGETGEYFHREQCAELLRFLKELKRRRADDGKD